VLPVKCSKCRRKLKARKKNRETGYSTWQKGKEVKRRKCADCGKRRLTIKDVCYECDCLRTIKRIFHEEET
jgi:hypothetical protein